VISFFIIGLPPRGVWSQGVLGNQMRFARTALAGGRGRSGKLKTRAVPVARADSDTKKPALFWIILGAAIFWYLGLITNFDFNVFTSEPFGRVFNQMLQRLLSGRFDIDFDVIRGEGYLHNGQLVSYFGVFPALLRLPFAAFVDLDRISLSRISCLLGLCVCAFVQLQMLWTAHQMLDKRHRHLWLWGAFAVALLLTGPQLTLTFSAFVYNEPIIWAAACAMLFSCVVLGELQKPTHSAHKNYLLAVLVGISFLCRPTTGIGLLVAFGVVIAHFEWRLRRARKLVPRPPDFGASSTLISVAILFVFGIFVAWIDFSRFGNIFTFNNPQENLIVMSDPRRMKVAAEHGLFEFVRLIPNFSYYFLGFPIEKLLPNLWATHYDDVGGPRSALLIKETVLIFAAALGAKELIGRLRENSAWIPVAGAVLGDAAIVLLLLGLPMTNYRYQMDLQPLFSLLAILGYLPVSRFIASHNASRTALACVILLAANVATSHFDLLNAKLRSFGMDDASRARVYAMTYPVSKLFPPKSGSGVLSASDFEDSELASTFRAEMTKASGAGRTASSAANN
jgi:hypothetical protein